MLTKGDFEALLSTLKESPQDYDYVAVADGAGTTLGRPAASCLVAYRLLDGEVVVMNTTASSGTNNYAELIPFVHFLWALDNGKNTAKRCLFISDSELIIFQGKGKYTRNANLGLWASIDLHAKNGYVLSWRHVPRNSNPINTYCDKRAKGLRIAQEKE